VCRANAFGVSVASHLTSFPIAPHEQMPLGGPSSTLGTLHPTHHTHNLSSFDSSNLPLPTPCQRHASSDHTAQREGRGQSKLALEMVITPE
jgi:hypothetical protein